MSTEKRGIPKGDFLWMGNYEIVKIPKVDIARPKLIVKQTHLLKGKKRLPFMGLFTTEKIRKYDFIGIYTGEFYQEVDDEDDATDVSVPTSPYAMNLSGWTIVPPESKIEGELRPMAMINEPPKGATANVSIVEWVKAEDALPGIETMNEKPAEVVMAAFHACRDIEPHEELYFHYGNKYDRRHYGRRPYNVGDPCNLYRSHIPTEMRPGPFLKRQKVFELPNDSFVELE